MEIEKVRENRLRRVAARRGLLLQKSRRRDPQALGYGRFMLVDTFTSKPVLGADPYAYSATLDDVEHHLEGGS